MSKYLQVLSVEFCDELCDLALAHKDRSFASIQDIYWYCCPRIRTDGVGKVRLIFHARKRPEIGAARLLDVVTSHHAFDASAVFSQSGPQRRSAALEVIHSAFVSVCRHFGWDTAPAESARQRIINQDFKLFERLKRPLWRKDRTISVQPWWRYDDNITLGLEFGGDLRRDTILTVLTPGIAALWELIGRLAWHREQNVVLWARNGRDYWTYNIPCDKVDFVYGPAAKGDPKGEYDLGMMYLTGYIVQKDRQRALYWISVAASHGFERARKQLHKLTAAS